MVGPIDALVLPGMLGFAASPLARVVARAPPSTRRLSAAASKSFVPIDAAMAATQVVTGMACATFWRGAWYAMDALIFPEDAVKSGAVTLAGGVGLFAAVQRVAGGAACAAASKHAWSMPTPTRYALMYALGLACVATWRGTWVLWDGVVGTSETAGLPLAIACHATGIGVLLSRGRLGAMLAPPAMPCMLRDKDVIQAATHRLPSFLTSAPVLVRMMSLPRRRS